MVLAACAQPTPERIVETVIVTEVVEVEGETVVQEVIKTVEVEVEVPAEAPAAEGPIMADGMVPCQPLPEMAWGSVEQASAAAPAPGIVSDVPKAEAVTSAFAQQGGAVYTIGVFEDVTTLNFWAANGPDNTVYNSYMLPQRLTLYGLSDKYFTFVPQVAADFPEPLAQEGDFWVVTVPIRGDILWSDGTTLTADDVAWTANAVLQLGLLSGNWSSWYDSNFLDRMEAVDATTVKIYYHTKPGLARHEWGVLQAPILNKAYWEPVVNAAVEGLDMTDAAAQAEAQDKLFAHDPQGEPTAGGFVFTKWEPGAFLQEDAYADYFDTGTVIEQWANGAYKDSNGLEVGTPEGDVETTIEVGPNVAAVQYSIYGDQNSAILAMKNGEVDFVLNSLGLQRGLADQLRSDPNLTVLENPTNGFRYMSFNNRRRPMNDCAFRQAVAVLIDKEFVTSTVLQGVAYPLYTFIPEANEAWYFNDVPKLGQGLTREERTNLAKEILKQAGFSWEGDAEPAWDADNRQVTQAGRLLMPDGTPVPPLSMPAPSPGYDPLRSTFAIWIETWMNEFGIPLKAELAGFNVIVPIIFTEQDFDMYILGWSLGLFPDFLYDFFAEEQAVQDGNNAGGYINPEFEELAKQLLVCEDAVTCKELSDQIQLMLATEVPYVLLFDTGIIEAYRSASIEFPYTTQLSGLQYTHQGGSLQTSVKVK
jgi:ABC-type transport system substrate-binding protein